MKRTINFIGNLHHKNIEGANLFNKDLFNIEFNGLSRDVVVNCSDINGPNGNVTIFGPQIDLNSASLIKNYPVNFLSNWVSNCAKSLNSGVNSIELPFPVNVEKFKPTEKTGKPIIYFKRRDIRLLNTVKDFMLNRYFDFEIFSYEDTYKEDDYMKSISRAPFCIWLGAHESQGFALQECLSSGTPIFVIDVNSLCDEISLSGHRYWNNFWLDKKATSAPYFDNTCGMISDESNWISDLDIFINKLDSYNTRKYILDNLSPDVISNIWLTKINKLEEYAH